MSPSSVAKRPVLGVLGGSFNPPHIGHVLLPTYVLSRGLATRILVAPCWVHPFAKRLTEFDTRLAMTRRSMAVHGSAVEVSTIERDLGRLRGGRPSYTIDLLDALAKKHPGFQVRPIIGTDITARNELQKWHGYERLVTQYPPIVVPRAGYADPSLCALPEVSSTDIRRWTHAVNTGKSDADTRERLAAAVPQAVLDILLRGGHRGEIWVVGRGHVASHAHTWLAGNGFRTRSVSAREVSEGHPTCPDTPPGGLWLLCRDADLPKVSSGVTRLLGPRPRGKIPVLHAAGAIHARSEEGLKNLADDGHPVGTLHPICSLRSECSQGMLAEASFGIEGDEAARAFALRLIGEQPWLDLQDLDANQRIAYHGACALAANHLAVLWGRATDVLVGQGHPPATTEQALRVLLQSSLQNLVTLGIPAGISGPLSRGDLAAVRRHVSALKGPASDLYRVLSLQLADLIGAGVSRRG